MCLKKRRAIPFFCLSRRRFSNEFHCLKKKGRAIRSFCLSRGRFSGEFQCFEKTSRNTLFLFVERTFQCRIPMCLRKRRAIRSFWTSRRGFGKALDVFEKNIARYAFFVSREALQKARPKKKTGQHRRPNETSYGYVHQQRYAYRCGRWRGRDHPPCSR